MKMRLLLSLAFAAALVCGNAVAQVSYNALGQEVGQQNLQTLHDNVNSTNAQNDTTDYTTDQPLGSGFGGPSLFNLGAAKITTCAATPDGSNARANQECDAVNFLAKDPLQPYAISPSDPVIAGATATMAGAGGTVLANGCVEKTTTTPASYTTEVCNQYYVADSESCTEGEVVDVTAQSQFACDVTNAYQYTQSCTDDVTCSPHGATCVPFTAACAPGANSCCTFQLTCSSQTTGTLTYNDCCPGSNPQGYSTQVWAVNDISQFYNQGVQYDRNYSGSRIVCDPNTLACAITFYNYSCSDPSELVPVGPGVPNPYVVPDAFNFPGSPASCTDTGGCSLLDSELR